MIISLLSNVNKTVDDEAYTYKGLTFGEGSVREARTCTDRELTERVARLRPKTWRAFDCSDAVLQ